MRNARCRCSCRDLVELSRAAERRRVLAELHDVLGQELTLLALECDLALEAVAGSPGAPGLGQIRRRAHRLIQTASALARGEQPVSLADALERARRDLVLADIALRLDPAPGGLPELPRPADAFLACVVREGVTNVLRHAPGATHCEIRARGAADLVLVISNDGAAAMAAARPGAGIAGLRERATALAARVDVTVQAGVFSLAAYLPAEAARRAG
jgi:two-component system sensor histidine kinase DesK